MDNGKQILDVSYGKFSCRLEGFEDSVETMKLVVGYFHELAGHEDFMDMELQAPDMATLQELTEEHAEGDVAITEEDGQIRLTVEESAEEDDDASEDLSAADFEEVEDLEDVADDAAGAESDDDLMDDDAAFASDLEEVAEAVDETEPTSDEMDALDPLDDDASVADKLNHIRSVVSGALPAETETDASDAEDIAEDLSEEEAEIADDGEAEEDLPDTFSDRLAALAASDENDEAGAEDMAAADDVSVAEPYSEAAMASNDDDAAFEEELAALEEEDALAAAETAETDEPASETDSDDDLMAALDAEEEALAEDLHEGLAEESAAEPEEAETSEDMLDATMAEDIDEDLAAEAETEVTTADADDLTSDIAEALEEPAMDDMAQRETAASMEVSDDLDDDVEEVTAPEVAEEPEAETSEEAAPVQENAAAAEDPNKPFLLTPNLAAPADEKKGDDEFDLASEVAKVEAEIAARPGNEVARHGLPRSVEDAMSRILSQTDQQLNAPESKRHRDAFAQLKAAVAATEAARQLGEKSKIVDPEGAFKDDLGAHDAEGKSLGIDPDGAGGDAGDNVTPLKLVATQAIENAEAANQEPVDAASEKLRRIAALKERDLTGVKKVSFADFAAQQGAADLIDMLEAAAAYITFVEGDPDFTRPQVMKVVQSASEKEITREEGLRSFGRLLRQARFIKLNNGRFQVAENTQYRPDDDWAAQG
ncbi:MAG: hypothetical protein AAFU41_08230 [Pseudomonadota bacterium]